MYNRYIPQPDGSYRRNRMQDSQRPIPQPPQQPQSPQEHTGNFGDSPTPRKRNPAPPLSAGSFLRQLDTEDLLVIVLLLLMAGDCEEDRNTALLTLALYLFL